MTSTFPSANPAMSGLVTATHTPFHPDGSLDVSKVEAQAEFLLQRDLNQVFIGGTTGECHSLTSSEREALTERWCAVARGTQIKVIVHVGTNSLAEATHLAAQAERCGAAAIAAMPPCYFKPADVSTLIACMEQIASAAPATPFYYYDIPALTGVSLSMADFLAQAPARIRTFAGLKYTNSDLMTLQALLRVDGGRWNVLYGYDEYLLGALALGCTGAVGSGYNFAGPIYQKLLHAFATGNLVTAREQQYRGVQLIKLLVRFGYLPATKALMGLLGLDLGPTRLPLVPLTTHAVAEMHSALETLGFFDWCAPSPA